MFTTRRRRQIPAIVKTGGGTPTGTGQLDFSNADNAQLLALVSIGGM